MAGIEQFANNGTATVDSGGTTAPPSGTVETWTATATGFPDVSSSLTPPTQCHVFDAAIGYGTEIILVTDISGSTWTVTRGAENTTPVAHNANFVVTPAVTAGVEQMFADHGPSATGVHGVSGDIVGTTDVQTLSNKTLDAAVASADPTANLGVATKQYVDASSVGGSLDTNAADIADLGSQEAGATGKAADAGHVHNMPQLDQLNVPLSPVNLNSQKITSLADGSAASDAATFGQIPTVANVLQVLNVKMDYGAAGDGSTDDTTAIQSALNAANSAGGGIVYFPAGTYVISALLTVFSNLTLAGEGDQVSIIKQTATAGGIKGVDCKFVTIRDVQLLGPGISSGSGPGIWLTRSANANIEGVAMDRVTITQFGSDGVDLNLPIASTLNRVISLSNATNGFGIYTGGTSLSFTGCYALGCGYAGYEIHASYSSLNGCASDSNGIGYDISGAKNVTLQGCGAEDTVDKHASYNGVAYRVTGSGNVVLSGCYASTTGGPSSFLVTSNSTDVILDACQETSPGNTYGTPTYSFQVDAGSSASVRNAAYITVPDWSGDVSLDGDPYSSGIVSNYYPPVNVQTMSVPNGADWGIYTRAMSAGYSISALKVAVVTSSGNVCVGVYKNDGPGGGPGTQVATSGSVACPAVGVASIPLTSAVTVSKGYWLALSADNTTAQFYGYHLSQIPGQSAKAVQTSSQFPLPATAPTSFSTGTINYFYMTS